MWQDIFFLWYLKKNSSSTITNILLRFPVSYLTPSFKYIHTVTLLHSPALRKATSVKHSCQSGRIHLSLVKHRGYPVTHITVWGCWELWHFPWVWHSVWGDLLCHGGSDNKPVSDKWWKKSRIISNFQEQLLYTAAETIH